MKTVKEGKKYLDSGFNLEDYMQNFSRDPTTTRIRRITKNRI
ncbi:MAG TPA: hypothetical protein VFR94_16505 [Nitrososphaeraceae archaeon]|nr:hypothetical protein [Nitrososphaeraceae archaeon]